MARKKISVGTWAYIWGGYSDKPIPFPMVVKRLKELKFDGIEFGAFEPHLQPNTKEKRKELKKMLDDAGLGISGVAAPFPSPITTATKEYLDVVKGHIEMCLEMGIPKLRTETVDAPTGVPAGFDEKSAFSKAAETWNASADLCAKSGIKFVWEFEPQFLYNKPSEVVRMVYKVDHPNFSVMFDTCHAYMCCVVGARQRGTRETLPGGVVQFAHMLTGKIGAVHFIDSDGTLHDERTSTHAPFGKGKLDFDSITQAILDAGYKDEWWPIDLCYWENALEATGPAKAFMDKLVSKYGA
ncbi:MAG TPA: sugar phosphate isomerase/epimerase family protein [Spirochaetia bacterium]|nr:sugar phosphate isomerase/epimerase family protein [Spirochaetia bacterium]